MTERVRCNPELVCIYGFGQVCFWINQWRFGQVCFCYATWWAQLLFRFRFFMGFSLGPSIGQCSHLYQRKKKITLTSQSQPSKSGWNLRPILGDQILRISQFFLVDKEATEGKKKGKHTIAIGARLRAAAGRAGGAREPRVGWGVSLKRGWSL